MTRKDIQRQTRKGCTSHASEERVQVTTSGVHHSQTTRNLVEVEEACIKRKYVMEDPIITLTEDDVDLVVKNIQDRGEEVVHVAEAQREEIMVNLIEVHEPLQQVRSQEIPHATM